LGGSRTSARVVRGPPVPRLESVLGPRYISEHMFDLAANRAESERGVDGWI